MRGILMILRNDWKEWLDRRYSTSIYYQSERNIGMCRILPIGYDELLSETALSQLSREFRMTRRKLHHFSKIGDVNKSSLSLELSNQSSRVIKRIVKAGAFVPNQPRAGNKTGKKLDSIINEAKVNRSGVGSRKLFETPFEVSSKISRHGGTQAGSLISLPNV